MAGMKEVAEAAGVSTATVSRVLTNQPHVRPDVRERVLAAIAKLEYRPNLVARSLRSQQSNAIGLIVSDIRNPYFTAVSRAVEDAAYLQGRSVMLCNTDENPEKEALYLNLLRDTNIAGVIFAPTRQTLDNFSSLGIDYPIVMIDRTLKGGQVDSVLLDNVAAGQQITAHLISNGYGRIAGLFGESSTTGHERRQGYEAALREAGIALVPELLRYVPARIEAGYSAALDMLRRPDPPDALLTTNSLLTAGALQAIHSLGLCIPNQIALASFDETTWDTLVQPALTLIAQPTAEIGKSATELLIQRIAEPNRPTRSVILQGQLLIRGSTAPRHTPEMITL
ncbi:MAG: LacI family DNA-binding transcriptional regulator [Oscillochloris sp.]|nr:LacI family DNA-binding transcriptional regulator [Oscillochloris sp.]